MINLVAPNPWLGSCQANALPQPILQGKVSIALVAEAMCQGRVNQCCESPGTPEEPQAC